MKSARRLPFACAVVAMVVSLAAPPPIFASQDSFTAVRFSYGEASANFDSRIRSVTSFESSPTALNAWAQSAATLGAAFDGTVGTTVTHIYDEASKLNPNATVVGACNDSKAALFGPYGSNFGLQALAQDYDSRLEDVYRAQQLLAASENKLLSKIAQEVADHQKVDPLQNALLQATQNAEKKIAPLYQLMLNRAKTLLAEQNHLDSNVNDCNSATHPTPTPTPKPKPTPTPTPAPKPAQTQKPGSGPTPPNMYCHGKWEFWSGFGWVCVG